MRITAETLIQRHDAIYQHAFKSGQYAAATKANTEISILTGHRVEKKEVGQPGEFDHLSDDELLQAIRECSVRLGLTPDAGSDTTRH